MSEMLLMLITFLTNARGYSVPQFIDWLFFSAKCILFPAKRIEGDAVGYQAESIYRQVPLHNIRSSNGRDH
jgi:hypothetical protein